MNWESYYPEMLSEPPPPAALGGFIWQPGPIFAILGLFLLFIILWPRRHARTSQKVPQVTHTDILPNSLLIKRTISKSAEDIQNRSTSELVSQWSTPPPVDEEASTSKEPQEQQSESSLLDIDDIHLQFLKLIERINKTDGLTNLPADLNVIDYRGRETLDQLGTTIRFPSLPSLEKKIQFEQKSSISMTFIPRNPKSLMTLTNRKSFFMKPIITSWCFTNFQNKTEKLFESQYYLGEKGFFEKYLNQLRRVRSDGDELKRIPRAKFLPSLAIKKNKTMESILNDSNVELVEKSTMPKMSELRNEDSMTVILNISNNNKRNHPKKTKDRQKINPIKQEIKKVSKNQENKAKKTFRFHSKKRANSKLYYMHHHPVSYANLLRGPQKADVNQIIKEVFENHKKFLDYIQYEFNGKAKRFEKELEDILIQEKNNKKSNQETFLTKKEFLSRQLIRIKVKKEALLMKEMKKIQKLNEQIRQCFELVQNESLNTGSNMDIVEESNYDSDTSIMLLYAKAWNQLQASLIKSKMNMKKKFKKTKRMIGFKKDYQIRNNSRPQSAASSQQWTTETDDNICDLKEASGRINLNINTVSQMEKFPLAQISSKPNINARIRPSSSNGDFSKISFQEKPEMIIATKSSHFIVPDKEENMQIIKSKKNVTFSEDNNNLNECSQMDEEITKDNTSCYQDQRTKSLLELDNNSEHKFEKEQTKSERRLYREQIKDSSIENDERIKIKSQVMENYMNMDIVTQIHNLSPKVSCTGFPRESSRTDDLLKGQSSKSKHSEGSKINTAPATFQNIPEQEIETPQKCYYRNLKTENSSRPNSQKQDKELDGSQKRSISRGRKKNNREWDNSQKISVSKDRKMSQKRDRESGCSQNRRSVSRDRKKNLKRDKELEKRTVSEKRKYGQKQDNESDGSQKRSHSRGPKNSKKRDEECHQKKKSFSPKRLKSKSGNLNKKTSAVRLLNELSNLLNDQTTAARNLKQSLMTRHAQEIKRGLNAKKDQAQNRTLNPYTGEASSHLNPRWKF